MLSGELLYEDQSPVDNLQNQVKTRVEAFVAEITELARAVASQARSTGLQHSQSARGRGSKRLVQTRTMQLNLFDNPDESRAPSPKLASCSSPRLIDTGLLYYDASTAGFAERYARGETSHTVHVWWARRPHSAMRALVFASLCKERTADTANLLTELTAAASASGDSIKKAKEELHRQYGARPRTLDMFAGGGTIPLEAARLGAQASAVESNQLAAYINRCNLIYSAQVDPQTTRSLLEESGLRVLEHVAESTAPLFPLRNARHKAGANPVTTYLWTYSIQCKNCDFRYYLSKRPWLSKKAGRRLLIARQLSDSHEALSLQNVAPDYEPRTNWHGRAGGAECPKCGCHTPRINIADCEDELVVLVGSRRGHGKEFFIADSNAIPADHELQSVEAALLKEMDVELPTSLLPQWSGIVNPALYGVRTHADFLNRRQRIVLLTLIKALKREYAGLRRKHGELPAKYVIGLLSGLIDQCVDWNCRLSMWIPQNEQVGRGFCGPGVSMLWDYVETDPALDGPANLHSKLKRIIEGASSLVGIDSPGEVRHAHAQNLPYQDAEFDAIVADPPYYDNIYYSVLADFFFSWKRILLNDIEPDLFEIERTDTSRELVASTLRYGESAHEKYCTELSTALREAARVMKNDAVFSLLYSHASLGGWDALVRAFAQAPLLVTSVQPLCIERRHRPRAMSSEAINTCLVFVTRKSCKEKERVTLDKFLKNVAQATSGQLADSLVKAGWQDADCALALFAQGAGILANCRLDGTTVEALEGVEQLVRLRFPMFKIVRRASL
jgi:putative DNA methylase